LFLIKLVTSEQKIRLDLSDTPEFDSWRWIDYDEPAKQVIFFKQQVYQQALKELEQYLKRKRVGLGLFKKRINTIR
jgi:putative (di)nucleoside polyphosphate hydrolase